MSDPGATSIAEGSVDDRIVEGDLNCLRCQYNLRELKSSGRCPECGLPIASNIWMSDLARLDPKWIRELRLAARLPMWSMAVGVIGILVVVVLTYFFDVNYLSVVYYVPAAIAATMLYGAWRFLTAPQSTPLDRDTRTARIIARVCILITAACVLFFVGCEISWSLFGWNAPSFRNGIIPGFIVLLGSPIGLTGAVGALAFTYYFEAVASLFNEYAVGARGRSYGFWFTGSNVFLAFGILMMMASSGGGEGACYFIGAVGSVIFGSLVLLLPYHLSGQINRRMNESLREAESESVA